MKNVTAKEPRHLDLDGEATLAAADPQHSWLVKHFPYLNYAMVRGLVPAIAVHLIDWWAATQIIHIIAGRGGNLESFELGFAGLFAFVWAITMGGLHTDASGRSAQDRAACGTININFGIIVGDVRKDPAILKFMSHIATYLYWTLEDIKFAVRWEGEELIDPKEPWRNLREMIEASTVVPDWKKQNLDVAHIKEIESAVGGIGNRRAVTLAASRYLVNILTAWLSVLMLMLFMLTHGVDPWIGHFVLIGYTVFVATKFVYTRQLEFGIGYDIPDQKPTASRKLFELAIRGAPQALELKIAEALAKKTA